MSATSKSCGAAIFWVSTTSGKAMPLDVTPVNGGNVEVEHAVARVVSPELGRARYVSHFSSCPNADRHRRAR